MGPDRLAGRRRQSRRRDRPGLGHQRLRSCSLGHFSVCPHTACRNAVLQRHWLKAIAFQLTRVAWSSNRTAFMPSQLRNRHLQHQGPIFMALPRNDPTRTLCEGDRTPLAVSTARTLRCRDEERYLEGRNGDWFYYLPLLFKSLDGGIYAVRYGSRRGLGLGCQRYFYRGQFFHCCDRCAYRLSRF